MAVLFHAASSANSHTQPCSSVTTLRWTVFLAQVISKMCASPPSSPLKGCKGTKLAAAPPNWVRLFQGQKQKVCACSMHTRVTFFSLRVAFRLCAHSEVGHRGREPTSGLTPCVPSLSSFPGTPFRAPKCLPFCLRVAPQNTDRRVSRLDFLPFCQACLPFV